jgi:membrane associated rhomboid family serine protease
MLEVPQPRSATLPDDQAADDRPEWLIRSTTPTTCYRHPDRPTGLRCSRCDRPICGECANPAPVGQLCPDDARSRVRTRGLPGQERPVATLTLLGINTALLLVEAAMSGGAAGLLDPSARALCRLGALNAAAIVDAGQWWRLLTVMVLHAGIIHWAFNSYALWAFGPALEHVLGRLRFVALYVGSGFLGAAASFAFRHTQLGVGASGAIFGLLGALIAFFFRRRQAGGAVPFQNLLLVLLVNVFLATRIANVDNLAHAGGLLGGLAAMALLEAAPVRARGWQAAALALPFVAGLALTAVGVASFQPAGALTCVGA